MPMVFEVIGLFGVFFSLIIAITNQTLARFMQILFVARNTKLVNTAVHICKLFFQHCCQDNAHLLARLERQSSVKNCRLMMYF